MPSPPADSSSEQRHVVLEVDGPLGHKITLDQQTLDDKTTKHGSRFTGLDKVSDLLSDPCDIYESQHEWAKSKDICLYYHEREFATGKVKYLRAVVKHVSSSSGVVLSIHPKASIGLVGNRLYTRPEGRSDDAES